MAASATIELPDLELSGHGHPDHGIGNGPGGLTVVRLHGVPIGTVVLPAGTAEARLAVIERELGPRISHHLDHDADAAGRTGSTLVTVGAADQVTDCRWANETPPLRWSVVVATRDRPGQLERCIASIVAARPEAQVVVVDNGSRDFDAVRQAMHRVGGATLLLSEPIAGASRARNRGIEHATGDVVAFTDDDVVVDARWFTAFERRFAREPELVAICGLVVPASLRSEAARRFEQFGGFNKGSLPRSFDLQQHRPASRMFPWAAGQFGSGNNMAFRADTIRRLGGFDVLLGPGTPTRAGEDLDLLVRSILRGGRLGYEPSALVWHQHRDDLDALARQLRDYGVGLSAMVTRQLVRHPKAFISIGRAAPAGLYHLLGPHSQRNMSRSDDFPLQLVGGELAGLVRGPVALARSRIGLGRIARAERSRDRGTERSRDRGVPIAPVLRSAARVDAVPAPTPTNAEPLGVLTATSTATDTTAARERTGAQHLSRSTLSLFVNTVLTGVLGVVFWAVAARNYPHATVGTASTLVAAMTLASGIGQLNLQQVIPRSLPTVGDDASRVVRRWYGAASVSTACVALVVALVLRALGSGNIIGPGFDLVWFVAASVAWTIFTVQDACLIGLRCAHWVPVENVGFAVVKIVLALALVSMSAVRTLFLAWMLPVAAAIIPVSWLLFARLLPAHAARRREASDPRLLRASRSFLAADYAGQMAALAATTAMPLVAAVVVGTERAAFFAVAWMVVLLADQVLNAVTTPLLVEGTHAPDAVGDLTRHALRLLAATVLPGAIVGAALAPALLGVMGADYRAQATTLMRLVFIGVLARSVVMVRLAQLRLARARGPVLAVGWIGALGLLGGGSLLMHQFGIVGVGWAYLTTQLCLASWACFGILDPGRPASAVALEAIAA